MDLFGTQPTPVGQDTKAAQEVRDVLAGHVMGKWQEAKWDRGSPGIEGYSIDQRLLRCLRASKCKFNPEDLAGLDEDDLSALLYIGISAKKSRDLKCWTKDVLSGTAGKWFSTEPTPIPDLPEEQEDQIIDRLKQEIREMQARAAAQAQAQQQAAMQQQMMAIQGMGQGMPGMPPMAMPQQQAPMRPPGVLSGVEGAQFIQLAKKLKDRGLRYAFEMAQRASKRAERKLLDQFTEGGMEAAIDDVIDDLSIFPFAIIEGPYYAKVRKLVWVGNQPKDEEVEAAVCNRVSPFDFYWSPDSTNCQNGAWIAKRARMSVSALYDCLGLEGVNDASVRWAIDTYGAAGYCLDEWIDTERQLLEDRPTISRTMGMIDVLQFHGKIPGSKLDGYGIKVDDIDRQYECCVWVCAGTTLRVFFNQYPLGARPFGKACFDETPGSFVGKSLMEILHETQRGANASMRALIKNMAFSSGPMGEVDADRLQDGESVDRFEPYRMIQTKSNSFNVEGPAVKFLRFPSVASEMLAVFDKFSKVADDLSGIPPYAVGQAPTGGAGRTLGGLSLLMANAAKAIKMLIAAIDRGIIKPVVTIAYNMLMLYDEDMSLKADVQVVVKGASGILERDLNRGQAIEMIQILQPFAGQMDPANPPVPPGVIQQLLRQIASSIGLDLEDSLSDPKQSLAYELQALGQQSPAAATASPIPLDGRSTSQMVQR